MVSNLRGREREREGKAEDALDACTGHDRDVGRDLDRQAAMRPPADAGIFALRILAHDHPVELGAAHLAQRARYPRQDAGGTDIGILVERLADRETQAPEADVIGHLGRADGAEIDRVVILDLPQAVRGHHQAGRAVEVRAPVEAVEGEFDPALAFGDRRSASSPAGITSLPIPSPGMTAIR